MMIAGIIATLQSTDRRARPCDRIYGKWRRGTSPALDAPYGWEHDWPHVFLFLLFLMSALVTLIAGAMVRLSGAFSPDHDGVRRVRGQRREDLDSAFGGYRLRIGIGTK